MPASFVYFYFFLHISPLFRLPLFLEGPVELSSELLLEAVQLKEQMPGFSSSISPHQTVPLVKNHIHKNWRGLLDKTILQNLT